MGHSPMQPNAASTLKLKGISAYGSACLANAARFLTGALKELSPSAGHFPNTYDLDSCKTPRAAQTALTKLLWSTETVCKGTFALIPPISTLERSKQLQIIALSEAADNAVNYLRMAIKELGTPVGQERSEGAFLACLQTAQRLHDLAVDANGLLLKLQRLGEQRPLLPPLTVQPEIPAEQFVSDTHVVGLIPRIHPHLNIGEPPLIASYISIDQQLATSMPILEAFVLVKGCLVRLDAVTARSYWQKLLLPRCSEVNFDPKQHSMLRLDRLSTHDLAIPIGLKYTPIAASAVLESGKEIELQVSACTLSGRYRAQVPADSRTLKIQIQRNSSPRLPPIELWQSANPKLAGIELPPEAIKIAEAVANSLNTSRLVHTRDSRIADLFDGAGIHRLTVFDGLRAGSCETLSALLAHKLTQNGIGAIVVFGGAFDTARRGIHCDPGHAQLLCVGGLFDPTVHTKDLTIEKSPRTNSEIFDAQNRIFSSRDSTDAFRIARRLGDSIIQAGEPAHDQTNGHHFEELWQSGSPSGQVGGGRGPGKFEQRSEIEGQLAISQLSLQIDEALRLAQTGQPLDLLSVIREFSLCHDVLKKTFQSSEVAEHFESCGIAAKSKLLFHEASVRSHITSEIAQLLVTCIGKWIEGTPLLAYALMPTALGLPDSQLTFPVEPLITRGAFGYIGGQVSDAFDSHHKEKILFLQLFEKLLNVEDSEVIREYARDNLVVAAAVLSGAGNGPKYSQKAAELFGQVVKIAAKSDRDIYDLLLRCLHFIDSADLPEYLKQTRRSPVARRWFNENGLLAEQGRAKLTAYTLAELLRKPSRDGTRSSPLQLIASEQNRDEGELRPVIEYFQVDLTPHKDAITRAVIAWVTHLKKSIGRPMELMACPIAESPFGAWLGYRMHYFDESCAIGGVTELDQVGLINRTLLQQLWPLASEISAAKALATTQISHRSPDSYYLACKGGPLGDSSLEIPIDDIASTLATEWLDSGRIRKEPLGQIAAARRLLGVTSRRDMQCQQWKARYPETWKALARAGEKVPNALLIKKASVILRSSISDYESKEIAIAISLLNAPPGAARTQDQARHTISRFLRHIDRTSTVSLKRLSRSTDTTLQGAIRHAEYLAVTAMHDDCIKIVGALFKNPRSQSYFSAPREWRHLRLFYAILGIEKLPTPPTAAESREIAAVLSRARRIASQGTGLTGLTSPKLARSRLQFKNGPNSSLGFERRSYAPGDDARLLDWRTTARLDKLVVRAYERDPLYQQTRLEIHLDLQRLVQSQSGAGILAELTSVAELYFKHSTATRLRVFFRGHELPIAGLPEIVNPRDHPEKQLLAGFITLYRIAQGALGLSIIFVLPVSLYGNTAAALSSAAQATQPNAPCQVLALPAKTNIHKTQIQVASCAKTPDFKASVM